MTTPNVLCIVCDDLGPWGLGCAGNPEIITPHLDALAASGTRFAKFFCTSPVCSPARASLMTGRIPSQHGVHDWIAGGNSGADAVRYLGGLPTYTEILAESGYECGISGKWHLGDSCTPQAGFSHWFVHERGSSSYFNAPMVRDGTVVRVPGYLTTVLTDDAIETIGRMREPWYMSVHYTAPHSPWLNEHPAEIAAFYSECAFDSCPEEPPHPWLSTAGDTSAWSERRENLRGYFTAVTAMDREIGRLVEMLERRGLRERTLVWFLSDNGFNCGHHGIWGKGEATFPLNVYESSVCVPAIASHPGEIPAGAIREELVSGYDFAPTLLAYLGLDVKRLGDELPGRSFAAMLRGKATEAREHVVVFDEYGPVRMIRDQRWKYVHRYPYGPHELYDLEEDPEERKNLAEGEPSPEARHKIAHLLGQLEAWFARFVVPELDGARQPVTGMGQLRRVDGRAGSEDVFRQLS